MRLFSRKTWARWALALVVGLTAGAAQAGPPFLTDDPEPTETGHWEIYAPAVDAAGHGGDYDGALGAEINYGAAPNVQLTVGLPSAFVHDADGLHAGRGDLELSLKYRFFNDEGSGFSVAVFPALTLPTASHRLGAGRVTGLLPVWAQKDSGPWSVFGGGGYAINPGAGNRNYWTGGLAVSRRFNEALLVGLEADWQGRDTDGGRSSTSLGLGAIVQLDRHLRLLGSAGPTFVEGERTTGFHAFLALGIDL
jgi:hypothetical protein